MRAGRLLRAGRIVQGSIVQLGESQLRVDAAVLDVPTAEVRGAARGEDALERLFDLEKRIAFGLFDELGVTLTVAERNAIERERTLGVGAGSPATVAVLPMRFSGRDSTLRPLGRGFAELLATDLSR